MRRLFLVIAIVCICLSGCSKNELKFIDNLNKDADSLSKEFDEIMKRLYCQEDI